MTTTLRARSTSTRDTSRRAGGPLPSAEPVRSLGQEHEDRAEQGNGHNVTHGQASLTRQPASATKREYRGRVFKAR